jgi:hypothetical protein
MSKCPTCGREKPKSHDQRKKFHAMCHELGKHIGLTPGKVKEAIKYDFFGIDEYKIGNKWYRAVKPSEQAEMAEYSDLITFTFQWAAENCEYVFKDGNE